MKKKVLRAALAALLVLAGGSVGYTAAGGSGDTHISAQTVSAPSPDSVRIIYSLDQKQNDKEIIALIEGAETRIYFAMYEFTLTDIADALVAAARRGVIVRGVVDSGESANSYDRPVIEKLVAAGIPVETERHASGTGIMHIKAIVTDKAYALGSYNWTESATTINDELLEIGTDPHLREAYENVLAKLFDAYAGTNALSGAPSPASAGVIEYTDAPAHIGEYASVHGILVDAYTAASGTVFLDFCKAYKTCPFSGVIFADDAKKFGDLSRYVGSAVTLTGKIAEYQGKAEIVLSDPGQLSK